MASLRKAGVLIDEVFFVYDSSGNPVTGLVDGNFTKVAYKNGNVNALTYVISEIGSGAYVAIATPTTTGDWTLHWTNATYNVRGWKADYQVTTDGPLVLADILNITTLRDKVTRGGRIMPASGAHGFIVAVYDIAGNPVTGLTSADFTVKFIRDDASIYTISFTCSPCTPINGYYMLSVDMGALVTAGGVANYVAKIAQASNSYEWNFEFDIVGNVTIAPTAAQVRAEMDANSTKLAHLQADLTATPPTAVQVRTEMDANSTKLAELDGPISGVKGAVWEELRSGHTTAGSMGEAAQDHYQALVLLLVDKAGNADRYTAAFFKNGALVQSSIASVTIEVIKAADGTDLVASTSMTVIGSTGQYRYTETVNRVSKGAAYTAKVGATIGGVPMSWTRPVGRDS
jgi:hypothetical protein